MRRRKKRKEASRCPKTGKVRFRDELAARLALAGRVGDKGSVRVYPCKFCGKWHSTSQKKGRT